VEELEILHTQQGQGTDLVDPTVEQPAAVEPAAPTMEEPPVTRPTSPSSGVHDKGDPSDKDLWSPTVMSANPTKVRVGTIGDVPSNAA